MYRYFLTAALGASLTLTVPVSSAADIKTLIQQKKDGAIKGPFALKTIPYTYVVTAYIKSGEGDDSEGFVAKYQVNPGAAPGARLTFLGDALETFPEEFQKQMEQLETERSEAEMAEEFWCADTEDEAEKPELSPEDITVIREDDREAVISISNEALKNMMQMDTGDGDEDMPKKIRKRLASELTLAKPDLTLRHMKVWLTEPTTIKIVAKIKEMNIEQSCALAPNGLPYVTTRKMRVSGKALGSSFMEDAVITVSDLTPL